MTRGVGYDYRPQRFQSLTARATIRRARTGGHRLLRWWLSPGNNQICRVWWRKGDPWELPKFLTPRFLRRRARLVGSPCWECARCGGHQGGEWSPRFCEFGCDDRELERFQARQGRALVVEVEVGGGAQRQGQGEG